MKSSSKWQKLSVSMGILAVVGAPSCSDTKDGASEVAHSPGSMGSGDEIQMLPVYDVIENGIDEARAGRLSEALRLTENALGGKSGALGEDGAIRYLDEARFQNVPTRGIPAEEGQLDEHGRPTAANDRAIDFEALAALRVLPDDVAIARVEAALSSAALPALEGLSVTHSTFEAVTKEGIEEANVELDTQVNGSFELDGRRLIGPGAKIKVVFNGEGVVTQMVYAARTLKRGDEMAIVPPSQANRLCEDAYAGMENLSVTSELVYYAPPLSKKVRRVDPHYLCSGTARVGGSEVLLRRIMLPALLERPEGSLPVEEPAAKGKTTSSLAGSPSPSAIASGSSVGTEWIGSCGGLSGSKNNANGFASTFASYGAGVPFNRGNDDAKEKNFKDPNKGGNDDEYVDSVDMAFYTGHAEADGFYFCSTADDHDLTYSDARWGQTGLEWLVIAACGPLQGTNDEGKDWSDRWGPAFVGLHLLLAYANESYDSETEGPDLASYLLVNQIKVRNAWVQAATNAQPSDTNYAFMGTYGSNDAMPNYDDYFWGVGPVGADQSGTEIKGFWRVKGGC